MPYLSRDNVSLYYELTEGEGAPVLLLHGWCCDHSFLAPQAAYFAARGHPILTLDFLGHGRSDKPRQAYPIPAFTDDVAWLCQQLGIDHPIVVGHSMGGIVAFDLAARWPTLPAAIVMIDSAVVLPVKAHAAVGPEAARLAGADHAAELRRVMETVFFLPTDDLDRKEYLLEIMISTPQHVMVAAYAGLDRYDAAGAGQVRVPSLYIAANEPSPRSDMVRLRTLLPDMHYGQTVGSGHFCQLEVPEQVNAMIDRFLLLSVWRP